MSSDPSVFHDPNDDSTPAVSRRMAPSSTRWEACRMRGRGQAGLVAHQQLEDEHAAQQEEDAVADGEAAEPQRVEADGGDAEPAEDQHRRDVAGVGARRRGLPLDPRLDGRRPSVRDVDGDPPTVAEAAPSDADRIGESEGGSCTIRASWNPSSTSRIFGPTWG